MHLLAPAIQGIYAADPENLSAELILTSMIQRQGARTTGGLISGPRGLGGVLQDLGEVLKKRGVEIKFGQNFNLASWRSSREKNEILVLATSASAASEILGHDFVANSKLLRQLNLIDIGTMTFFWPAPPVSRPAFGGLIPRDENILALGVLFNTFIFARPFPFFSETWILSSAKSGVEERLLSDRRRVFASEKGQPQAAPVAAYFTAWPAGLPRYDSNLQGVIKSLEAMPGIYLHGNYLGKIGLSRILELSQDLAKKIIESERIN